MTKRHPQKKKRKKKTSGKCSQDEEQRKREVANSRCSQVSTKFVTGEGTDEQPDFTSKLPNETLQHIISFLPLQSAAQTRLLSSHWRQAWNVVSDKTGRVEDLVPVTATFLSSVNWVLNPSTHAWKLRFQTEDGKIEMIATTGVNNKLRLDFSGGDKTNLPRYYDLELEITDEHCLQHPSSYPISSADYFQVKSLCLVGVDQLSGEMVSSLIWEHLHSLERLEIRECHSLTGLIISPDYGSRTLERLEIRECHSLTGLIISPDNVSHTLKHISIIDCDHLESVTTDLPYTLNSFRYRAQSFPRDLNMRRVRFMPEDVMFDFRKGTAGYNDNEDYGGLQFYLNVVWYLNQARHITISQWTFQVMIKPNLQNNSDVKFNDLKELWWTSADSMGEDQIDDLISFLLVCPAIEKLFVTVDRSPAGDSLLATKRITGHCSKPRRNRKTRLRKLKLVKMEGFPDEDMMLLADRILKIATNDPDIMATSRYLHPRSLVKIHPERWRFVEEINIELINTKHMHMRV